MPIALIVDPDEASAARIGAALARLQIETAWQPDSEGAIQYCRKQRIDAVVCRIILDDLTGYELIAEMRKEQSFPAVVISKFPLIIIRSVRGFNVNEPLMLEPFKPEDVAAEVSRLIARGQASAETS